MLAGRELAELKEIFPSLEIEEIDVVAFPLRAWKDGIRFIPALKAGDTILTGLLLKRKQIRTFLEEC